MRSPQSLIRPMRSNRAVFSHSLQRPPMLSPQRPFLCRRYFSNEEGNSNDALKRTKKDPKKEESSDSEGSSNESIKKDIEKKPSLMPPKGSALSQVAKAASKMPTRVTGRGSSLAKPTFAETSTAAGSAVLLNTNEGIWGGKLRYSVGQMIRQPKPLPYAVKMLPTMLVWGFIFHQSFMWLGPFTRPDLFKDEDIIRHERKKFRSQRYFEWNAQREGVVALESGLQFRQIGRGKKSEQESLPENYQIQDLDQVVLHFEGQFMNGKRFSSSVADNRPVTVKVGNLIDGLREGIKFMRVGDTFEFFVPAEMGYGDTHLYRDPQRVDIPKSSTLIYCVRLLEVVPFQVYSTDPRKMRIDNYTHW